MHSNLLGNSKQSMRYAKAELCSPGTDEAVMNVNREMDNEPIDIKYKYKCNKTGKPNKKVGTYLVFSP